jgi:AraC-like DNA-binding protein
LSEIAFEAGFRDYKFFSSKFRQRFGCGPAEYAQSDGRFGGEMRTSAEPSALDGKLDGAYDPRG